MPQESLQHSGCDERTVTLLYLTEIHRGAPHQTRQDKLTETSSAATLLTDTQLGGVTFW